MTQPTTLEEALEAVERDADAAIRSLGAALKAAKKAKSAAATGQIRDLQQALDNAAGLASQAASAADELRAGWRFDVGEWFSTGQFAKELLGLGRGRRRAGLRVRRTHPVLSRDPAGFAGRRHGGGG